VLDLLRGSLHTQRLCDDRLWYFSFGIVVYAAPDTLRAYFVEFRLSIGVPTMDDLVIASERHV